jgi:hypothetical protein
MPLNRLVRSLHPVVRHPPLNARPLRHTTRHADAAGLQKEEACADS